MCSTKYGLLINGVDEPRTLLDLTIPPTAKHWRNLPTRPTPMSMPPSPLCRKRSKHGARPPQPNAPHSNKIADVIDENLELFALQETLDNGKPIRETRAADIPRPSDHFRYFASVIRGEEGTATQLDPEDLSIVLRDLSVSSVRIIPWNFPFLMAAGKSPLHSPQAVPSSSTRLPALH